MKTLAILLVMVLLAGCTQLDDAKEAAAEAQRKIDEAKREAQEAKDRYDRVKSATIVRTEKVHLAVYALSNDTTVWFRAEAERAGTRIADANVTGLPLVKLSTSAWSVTCDPIDCRVDLAGEDVTVEWADGTPGLLVLKGGRSACDGTDLSKMDCASQKLDRDNAEARVTTKAGDVTG